MLYLHPIYNFYVAKLRKYFRIYQIIMIKMGKQCKKVREFLERLEQTGEFMENLVVDLENEMECVRDQAVLVLRGGLTMSKFVKATARYVEYVRKSSMDHGEEVEEWLPVWRNTMKSVRGVCRCMKAIAWKVDECSYRGTPYYSEALDGVSRLLVEKGQETVKAFCNLARQEQEYVKEVRTLLAERGESECEAFVPEHKGDEDAEVTPDIRQCFRMEDKVEEFLDAIRKRKCTWITSHVARLVHEGVIHDGNMHNKPLWEPLHRAGLYPSGLVNWNKQIRENLARYR